MDYARCICLGVSLSAPFVQLLMLFLLLLLPLSPCCCCLVRLWFTVEPEQGDLFLIEPPDCDSNSSSTSNCDAAQDSRECRAPAGLQECVDQPSLRAGLPGWLCADIPVIPADCSAAQGAMSRADAGKLLELCCAIKVTGQPRVGCSRLLPHVC